MINKVVGNIFEKIIKRKPEATAVAQREHCLDLFRGVCLLSIIFEHTCLIVCGGFIPKEWARWTMLLDIPALFFVSGMTFRTVNRDMIVNSLFKLSVVFTLLSFFLNAVYGRFSWGIVLKPLFLNSLDFPSFYLEAQGSYWFVPVYVSVLILATVIIKKAGKLYGLMMLGCLGVFCYSFFLKVELEERQILGAPLCQVLFYLGVFLFGFFCKDKVIGRSFQKEVGVLLLVGALGVYYLTYLKEGKFVFDLYLNKFPPRLPFVAVSFVSIAVFIFFYKSERRNFLIEHIGQNAIYYYAGQGIGECLGVWIAPSVLLPAYLKLPVMFLCNFLITGMVAEMLRFMYNTGGVCYRRMTFAFGERASVLR